MSLEKDIKVQEKIVEAEHLRIDEDHAVLQAQYHEHCQTDAPSKQVLAELEAKMDELKVKLLEEKFKLAALRSKKE